MSHTTEWRVRLDLVEDDRMTKARVELDTGTATLTGHGTARRSPQDADVPVIGDELAAARAMENLADQLKRAAYGDMAASGSAAGPESLRPYAGWPDLTTS
ncbi:dsRBD fold-containing protein [Streptomyces sp. NRRL S-87]|uniref:dsRBD fold-containing protein n=1 Tax=Streptomyces sp. NRRL S-87 TaxID=1463920 RepID=UPI0004C163CD|nr:dsRBD fold-containing protein [Streptomyces sp. NRRL S-87]